MQNHFFRRALFCAFFTIISMSAFSQNQPFWSNNLNNVQTNDRLGSNNAQPLRIYTNNLQRMVVDANGNVGIGLTSPQYLLHVNGSAKFEGTIFAQGVVIANKLQADTVKGTVAISVNNNLNLSGGTLNEIYAYSGDVRIQSRAGFNGNVALCAGTNGNVGIGNYNPAYKMDVNGDVRLNGKTYVYRIAPLPGDSEMRFGDSSIIMSLNNQIYTHSVTQPNGSVIRGLALGSPTGYAYGNSSITIGVRVQTSALAAHSVVIGYGGQNYLTNTHENSLLVGFNSDIPTLFVSGANGTGTLGKVGIGTSSPLALFQVGDSYKTVDAGAVAGNAANDFSISYFGMNASYNSSNSWDFQSDGAHNGGVLMEGTINGGLKIFCVQPSTANASVAQNLTDQQLKDNFSAIEVRADGRVMIGKGRIQPSGTFDLPDTRMTVDGRIMCNDLVISTIVDWSDFVFDSTYALMSIDSLHSFVKANSHLPNMPSAKELENDGGSLSDLCKKQQEEIEQLTLYLFQLNERMKAIEAQSSGNTSASAK